MNVNNVINGQDMKKKFRGFELNIPSLQVPKGFATALIGENGAGKTTLLNILAGIRLDYKGNLTFFDEAHTLEDETIKDQIGYTGPGNYYLPNWTVSQVKTISELLFENFSAKRFESLCEELGISINDFNMKNKKVIALSDGMRMKLMLAGVLARDTKLLILDEPASPLDPLMRDKLCELIRDYLDRGNGETSVFFSTHNISDMENVTDYAIIMEHGTIVEQGFVEDLKEKYILVKGDKEHIQAAKKILYSCSSNQYGFEGICLSSKLDQLAGMDVSVETPSLSQISIAVMKANTKLQMKFA